MRHLFEPEGVSYFGYVPGGLLQQYPGFLVDAAGNDLGGGLSGGLLKNLVQVVDVDLQVFGEVAGGPELQHLGGIFDRELPLKQFDEKAEYTRRRIDASAACFHGFELLSVMNKFEDISPKKVVFERIAGVHFSMHLAEHHFDISKLFKRYLKYKIALRGEDWKFLQFETRLCLRHEVGGEHAEVAILVFVERHIPVWYSGRGEQDGVVLDVQHFIRILDPVSSLDQAYFIVCSAIVGHVALLLAVAVHGASVEHVEMADFICTLVFEEMVDFRTDCAENLRVKLPHRCRCHAIVKFKVKEFMRNNRGCR